MDTKNMREYDKKIVDFHSYMLSGGYRMNQYGQYIKKIPGTFFKKQGCWLSYPTGHHIYTVNLGWHEVERLIAAYKEIFPTAGRIDVSEMDRFRYYCMY